MSFSTDIAQFVDVCKKDVDNVVRAIVIDIGEELIDRSPVGDPATWITQPSANYKPGHFKANWQYGFNTAPSGEIDAVDPSGNASSSRIRQGLASVVELAGIHYLCNNTPYAMALENGWSEQAPHGIVALTVLSVPGIAKAHT